MSFDAPPGSPFGAVASDPHAPLLNASCLDLLLIELVPMAERLAKELSTTDDKQADEEEIRETTFFRLESLGYRVGQGLAERSFATVCKAGGENRFYHLARLFGPWHEKEEKGMDVHMLTHFYENRFSRDRPRFTDNLDVIKFLCKDLWTILFRKQIDNLKTNHRGVYVLTDNSFRPFARMSMAVRTEAVAMAQAYLYFPCGVIRGALANIGISTSVQAESSELPGATFQIKTVQSKS